MTPDFIVIGAGPSGLSFAILVAKRLKRSVVVYDALTRLDQDFEDSYPIGLNPRGLKALEQIDHQVTWLFLCAFKWYAECISTNKPIYFYG